MGGGTSAIKARSGLLLYAQVALAKPSGDISRVCQVQELPSRPLGDATDEALCTGHRGSEAAGPRRVQAEGSGDRGEVIHRETHANMQFNIS